MNTELIDTQTIAAMLKISHRQARDRIVKHPTFPRPALSLSQKIRRWAKKDVETWLESQRRRMVR